LRMMFKDTNSVKFTKLLSVIYVLSKFSNILFLHQLFLHWTHSMLSNFSNILFFYQLCL
jgi:hypothetical protein